MRGREGEKTMNESRKGVKVKSERKKKGKWRERGEGGGRRMN